MTQGHGQVGFADLTNDFAVTEFMIRQALAKIHILMPAKIVKVTLPNNGKRGQVDTAGTVDVQLLTNQLDGLGTSQAHGIVYGLPYHRVQSGDSAHIMDPVVGDIGHIIIPDRDMSAVVEKKDKANPGSSRRFDPADGIFHGGILNSKPKQYMTYTDKGTQWADKNKNNINQDDKGMVHTDGVNNQTIKLLDDGITHTSQVAITHNAPTTNVQSDTHNINALTNISGSSLNVNAITNIGQLLKVGSIAQLTSFSSAVNGGTTNLKAAKNLIGS